MDGSSAPLSNTSANVMGISVASSSIPNGSSSEMSRVRPANRVPGAMTSVVDECVLRRPERVNFTAKYATVLAATFFPAASARCNKAAAWAIAS
jgi:hypothetical protein